MPRLSKIYGWVGDDNKVYLSPQPRLMRGAANEYPDAAQALADAGRRKLKIEWENIEAVDAHQPDINGAVAQ